MLTRNEKGRFVSKKFAGEKEEVTKEVKPEVTTATEEAMQPVVKELTDEQRDAICYKSKLLNKYFDSYDEMLKAEDEYKKAEDEKTKAVTVKRDEAKAIEDAYSKVIEARKEAAKIIDEANAKAYEITKTAEDEYYGLRDEFINKYGSYHMTYSSKDTDGNNGIVTVSDMFDHINNMFKWFW